MSEPQLVVMAAGIGSRYGGLKQIEPVGPSGELIIDYAIYAAIEVGFSKVIFIIRKEFEEIFRQKVSGAIEGRVETAYVFQEMDNLPAGLHAPRDRTKPWGTGHAVLCVADAVGDNFAVINADDFYGRESFRALYDYLKSARDDNSLYDFSTVGFVLDKTLTEYGHVARGICTAGDDDLLSTVVERTMIRKFPDAVVKYSEDGGENWTDIRSDSIVSMNMWGFTPGVFAELRQRFIKFFENNSSAAKTEFYVPTVVNELVQEGKAKVKILHTDEQWFGVTYKEDTPMVKQAVRQRIDSGHYPENLWG